MGCHSSKAPASATPAFPEAHAADFMPTKTLLTAGGNSEVKTTQSMRQFMRDSTVSMATKGSSILDEPRTQKDMTLDDHQAQPAEAENSLNCSTNLATEDKASFDVADLVSPGLQTMNRTGCSPSEYEDAEPNDRKLEIQKKAAQEAQEPQKEDIPTGSEAPRDIHHVPYTDQQGIRVVSQVSHGTAAQTMRSLMALHATSTPRHGTLTPINEKYSTTTERALLLGNLQDSWDEEPDIPTGSFASGVAGAKKAVDKSEEAKETPEPITTINRVDGPSASAAISTCVRKERRKSCC